MVNKAEELFDLMELPFICEKTENNQERNVNKLVPITIYAIKRIKQGDIKKSEMQGEGGLVHS